MCSIHEFLTGEFLPMRCGLEEPDGRLLYLYECTDCEFWRLVNLLRETGAPNGHDFDEYRRRWIELREEHQGGGLPNGLAAFEETELDWTVRGFVLYASEFWRRFRNMEWRQRNLPGELPFRKLKWLQFLSLVDWAALYHVEQIAGRVPLEGGQHYVAHANQRYADAFEWDAADAGHYPGLYVPMLKAWDWWKVAPVRLPSSIRYLDTFAHQGGAGDRLVIEFSAAYGSGSKITYRPVKPPHGYGIDALSIEKEALPKDTDLSELNLTLLFGPHEETGGA